MAAVISGILLLVASLVSVLLVAAYIYSKNLYNCFKRGGIPYARPTFPFGSLLPVITLRKPYILMLTDMYNKYKKEKFVGFFQLFQKSVLIIDRELIKQVLVKDFEYFDGKNVHYNKDLEPLSAHLFSIDGDEWKLLRTKMSPTFSSGKLKGMFDIIIKTGLDMRKQLSKEIPENDVVECKDLFTRYGLAIIVSTAFGLESDVLTDKSSMFLKLSEAITSPTLDGMFRNALLFYARDIARVFNFRIIPKQTHDFFMNLLKDTVNYRETSGKTRNDFLQLLMQLRRGTAIGGKEFNITMNELAAQSYLFVLAGFETSSNTMSYFLYEMAMNPEVQKRVQEEVDVVEDVTYDTLANFEYLDMAIDETLRKYAPLGFLGRLCTRDYVVPGTQQVIERGTHVIICSHALHWDPDLFPEPDKFIPERFRKENKGNIKSFSYLPFGEGPRFCIGMRFGKLIVKAGLALLMKHYEVRLTQKSPVRMKFHVKTATTTPEGGMWLQFVHRQSCHAEA